MSRATNEPLRRVTVTIEVEGEGKHTFAFPAAEMPRVASEYHHGEHPGEIYWERSPVAYGADWALTIRAHRDDDLLWTETREGVSAASKPTRP